MRNFAADGEWSKNFSGACEAVKQVGAGAFMISPGDLDVDPPSAVRDMISEVLGEDYPWYPVLGNHDRESPSTMRYLRACSMTVPHVVNRGPLGCGATTYSFDWRDAHFVVLNQYFDGVNDWGLEDQPVIQTMAQFFDEYGSDPSIHDQWYEAQIEGRGQTRSSFFKVFVGDDEITVEIYRDDAHGGPYTSGRRFY
jgi:hypothetical protein